MQNRVRAKICGITRVEDAIAAVEAGADAIGMILHADSPRAISKDQAVAIRKVIPPLVSVIGVTVNASLEQASALYHEIRLDCLQLHGEENRGYASSLNLPYIRAIRASSKEQIKQEMDQHSNARAFLLDPFVDGQHGGTGHILDLSLWPQSADKPLILAGGLSPENLPARLAKIKPFAVDLNSGLERAPGHKSRDRIDAALAVLQQQWVN